MSFRASDRCHWRGNLSPRPQARNPLASLCEAAQCSPRSKYPWGAHWVVRSEAELRCHGEAVTEGLFFGRGRTPPLHTSTDDVSVLRAGRCTPRVLASLRGHRPLRNHRRRVRIYFRRTESSASTHVHRKIMRPPSGGSFHLIACSSPSNTGALKNSPSVMSSPSQSILMVSSLGF